MNSIKLFWSFAKLSFNELRADKAIYLKAFFSLILLGNIDSIFHLFGVIEDSGFFLFLTILTTLLTFIVLSSIVLIQKIKEGGDGELKHMTPGFLLYNLYYSFLFFAGLVLFVIPGFYVLFYYSLVSFVAVLDDECRGSYFVESKLLVRKNLGLIIVLCLTNLFLECSSLLLTSIQNPMLKAVFSLVFSVPEAICTLVMIITFVKIYYYLKRLPVPLKTES